MLSVPRRVSRRAATLTVAALLAGLAFAATPAVGDAIDDRREAAEREQAKNERERADAEEAMEGLEGELGAVSDRPLEIQAQLPAARLALEEANATFAKAKRELALVTGRLEDAQEQAADLETTMEADSDEATRMREAIGQMAREAYRGGGDVSSVSMILTPTRARTSSSGPTWSAWRCARAHRCWTTCRPPSPATATPPNA